MLIIDSEIVEDALKSGVSLHFSNFRLNFRFCSESERTSSSSFRHLDVRRSSATFLNVSAGSRLRLSCSRAFRVRRIFCLLEISLASVFLLKYYVKSIKNFGEASCVTARAFRLGFTLCQSKFCSCFWNKT